MNDSSEILDLGISKNFYLVHYFFALTEKELLNFKCEQAKRAQSSNKVELLREMSSLGGFKVTLQEMSEEMQNVLGSNSSCYRLERPKQKDIYLVIWQKSIVN